MIFFRLLPMPHWFDEALRWAPNWSKFLKLSKLWSSFRIIVKTIYHIWAHPVTSAQHLPNQHLMLHLGKKWMLLHLIIYDVTIIWSFSFNHKAPKIAGETTVKHKRSSNYWHYFFSSTESPVHIMPCITYTLHYTRQRGWVAKYSNHQCLTITELCRRLATTQ